MSSEPGSDNNTLQIESGRPSTSPAAAGLARRGYVEVEHVVRGIADLYGYEPDEAAPGGRRTVRIESGLPFTTRVLVRRPVEPTEAARTVILEPLHPAGDMPSAWPRVGRAITRAGYTWVGVTQDLAGLAATKGFDPDRYAELDIPKVGLGYDIVAQVAAELRRPQPGFELGSAVDHMLMTGASYTGTFQRVFLGDGFAARTRRPDGGPAIEGYLIQISSGGFGVGGYNPINPDAERLPLDDPRRTIGGHGVPVIELLGEGEAETHRLVTRPDSDDPADSYRLYAVPGGCHMSGGERGHGPLAPTVEEPSDFPMWAIAGATLENLRAWVVDGTPPPRADRIAYTDDPSAGPHGERADAVALARDELGNAVGGVRNPWVDVPVARYYPHSTLAGEAARVGPGRGGGINMGDLLGCMRRFDADQLRTLYGTPAEYQRRFGEALAQFVADRWINPADVPWLLDQAAAIEF